VWGFFPSRQNCTAMSRDSYDREIGDQSSPESSFDSEMASYAEQRFKDGLECARKATYYDGEKQFGGALSFYDEAVEALYQACNFDQKYAHIIPQVEAYTRRAAEIRQAFSNNRVGKNVC